MKKQTKGKGEEEKKGTLYVPIIARRRCLFLVALTSLHMHPFYSNPFHSIPCFRTSSSSMAKEEEEQERKRKTTYTIPSIPSYLILSCPIPSHPNQPTSRPTFSISNYIPTDQKRKGKR
jgi:hypothetical protein